MYISKNRHLTMGRIAMIYLLVSAFCALFSGVYEHFSHGVISYYMFCLCLFPLLLGALPFFLLHLTGRVPPSPGVRRLWHCAVATLTFGSCVSGILEIYGTTSPYTPIYWIAGGVLIACSLLWLIICRLMKR